MESDPETRAARALAMQARIHPANQLLDPRALVSPAANWRKAKGMCPWCNQPSSEPQPGWHPMCRRNYFAARGATHYEVNGTATPLVAKTPCAKCGAVANEIDHTVSLAVARNTSSTEMLKAWTVQNLQWLCASCHSSKTTTDIRSNRQKTPHGKAMQRSMF